MRRQKLRRIAHEAINDSPEGSTLPFLVVRPDLIGCVETRENHSYFFSFFLFFFLASGLSLDWDPYMRCAATRAATSATVAIGGRPRERARENIATKYNCEGLIDKVEII